MTGNLIDYGERGQVHVVADPAALAVMAAELVRDVTREAVSDRGSAFVALSGGSTPKAMGGQLGQEPLKDAVPWGSTNIFWGDERWVPIEDSESNAGEAIRGFLNVVPIPRRQVHPFLISGEPAESASAYEQTIRALVPGQPVPMFDLILLGMGDDGHTASLFPGTGALKIADRLVAANQVEKLGATRLTFTAPLINAARTVAFVLAGAAKAARLTEVLDGPRDIERLPSQLIRPRHGRLLWLVDEAAAANLTRTAN
jgi:6-phosphogluconolactonase